MGYRYRREAQRESLYVSNYRTRATLDILDAEKAGRISEEERKVLISLIDKGRILQNYGKDALECKVQFAMDSPSRGRKKI